MAKKHEVETRRCLHPFSSMSVDSCDSGLSRTVRVGHFGVCVHLVEVGLVAFGGGFDGVLAWVPVRGADLAVLVGELEGVDEAKGLVHAAADGEVVDGNLYTIHVSRCTTT
jgi:hypothetical protein